MRQLLSGDRGAVGVIIQIPLCFHSCGSSKLLIDLILSSPPPEQKETPSDVQLHMAAMRGDEVALLRVLDSGKVHVDCKDEVSLRG